MGVPDIQAVVLAAGHGSRFGDITSQKAKCLLPIGNLPMIWFPLKTLEKAGFSEVIIIVNDNSVKNEVAAIPKKYGGLGDLRLDIHSLQSSSTSSGMSDFGTAHALKMINNQLESPRILVISSDLVTDVQLYNVSDLHRTHNAAVTALFSRSSTDFKSVVVPGPKNKYKKERDLVGVDASTSQLCYLSSMADLDEFVKIRRSLMAEHPRISMLSNLTDAHCYIMERWVCDFLAKDDSVASIKGELIPYLVRKQFSTKRKQATDDEEESDMVDSDIRDIDHYAKGAHDAMSQKAQELSSWNDHSGDLEDAYHDRPLRCYAFILEGGTCVRANNLFSYCYLNRHVSGLMSHLAPDAELPAIHPNSKVQPKATVTESHIGDGSYISDKTTTKGSMIGKECKVEEKVRITNCFIMDNVTIKEGCNVSGSIICDGVVLPEQCEIKDCIVGKGFAFNKETKHANEILMDTHNRMMEI